MADGLTNIFEQAQSSLSTLTNSCTNVSRRRLAFRPQSVKAPLKPVRVLFDAAQPSTSASADHQAKTDSGCATSTAAECEYSQQQVSLQQNFQKTRRRLVTNWSFQETLVFYDGLKQNGKDFEAIARYMTRKKFSKDRDQIRNYYFNAFKIWKAKAQIEECDWSGVPRDARELFVVLNGCEWRKKTGGANFDAVKFKTLVLEGTTSVRIKKKKSLVTIRTPYCPCLLKFFPYDKRNAEIPTHLSLKLTPLRYIDRNFVVSSEQNPLLHLRVNINDKILNIFELLEKKWTAPLKKLVSSVGIESRASSATVPNCSMRLRVTEGVQIHKVQVYLDGENFPLMSLRKLKRDYDGVVRDGDAASAQLAQHSILDPQPQRFPSTSFSADENSNEAPKNFSTVKSKVSKDCNIIKLGCSAIKEVFDLDEAKLKEGITKENIGNASILQLFYLCGMMDEIMLTYEISEPPINLELSWQYFVSLVERDYGELMTKSLSIQNQIQSSNTLAPTPSSSNSRIEEDGVSCDNTIALDCNATAANHLKSQDTTVLHANRMASSLNAKVDNNLASGIRKRRGKFSSTSVAPNALGKTTSLTTINEQSGTVSTIAAPTSGKDNASSHVSSVVERENEQFLQQLREMQQQTNRRVKRQVRVLPSPKRRLKSFTNNQRSQQNQQLLQHCQQQQQYVPVIEMSNHNTEGVNNRFCNVLTTSNFIQTNQPFSYVIASTSADTQPYALNSTGTILNDDQHHLGALPTSTLNQFHHQQQEQTPQLSSIIYQAQEIVADSQPVFAFLQNNGNAVSVVPVVTTNIDLNSPQQQFSNITECSVDGITGGQNSRLTTATGAVVGESFAHHNPPPPTDFSHFLTASRGTSVELQSFIPVSEAVQFQTSANCLQPFSSAAISASFRSPNKAGYTKRHAHYRPTSDSELTNGSAGDFSIDSLSLSAFVGGGSGMSSVGGLGSNQQISANSSSVLLLDSSPSKTLPEDVRNAYEQMLKENSIDYCRNFEQLTRNMDLIHTNVGGNSHDGTMVSLVGHSGDVSGVAGGMDIIQTDTNYMQNIETKGKGGKILKKGKKP